MLDKEQDEEQQEQAQEITTEEVIQQIEQNNILQQEFRDLKNASLVNTELSEEILAIMREIEGNYFDESEGKRYLNYETHYIPYSLLRKAGESEPARLIINKRRLDLNEFGKLTTGQGSERGVKLEFSNPDYTPSKLEKMELKEWERRIFPNFFYPSNSTNPNFPVFLGNAYEDFFVLDDVTLEIRTNSFDKVLGMHIQDPILYKPIIKPRKFNDFQIYQNDISDLITDYQKVLNFHEQDNFINIDEQQEEPDYLLIYQNRRYGAVTREKVRKFHHFVRSDFKKAQRGYSITEQGLRMITHILNAINMNASNFTNNRTPQGFFAFTGGGVNQIQLERLKKLFYAYQSGASNSNRFPMLSLTGEKSDVKWIGVRGNSKDLEYHQFMSLLFSILCQFSGTDPREVSMGSYSDVTGKKSLFEESTDGIIKESKDAGLRTFLNYMQDCFNSPNRHGYNIFQKITSKDVKLKFVGLEVEDKKAKMEILKSELATTKSMNEILATEDKAKQKILLGEVNIYDVPGFQNPQVYQTLLFNAQQKAQQEAMQQQQQPQQMQQQGQPEQLPEEGADKNALTDKDKELINKYKNDSETNIDEELLQEINDNNPETENDEAEEI